MEDTNVTIEPYCVPNGPKSFGLLVAVFDGHNGPLCSQYLAQHLPDTLESNLRHTPPDHTNRKKSIQSAFLETDRQWLENARPTNKEDGSTAICVILQEDGLFVANLGDSRAVMFRAGTVVPLSRDHKPTDEDERTRILGAGGKIIGDSLMGTLAVTRAFGDLSFKTDGCGLTSEPEIGIFPLSPDIDFIIVASDGLWDQFTNEEICNFVKQSIDDKKQTLDQITKYLVDEAVDRGSQDNVTLVIVKFHKKFKKNLEKFEKQKPKSKTRNFKNEVKNLAEEYVQVKIENRKKKGRKGLKRSSSSGPVLRNSRQNLPKPEPPLAEDEDEGSSVTQPHRSTPVSSVSSIKNSRKTKSDTILQKNIEKKQSKKIEIPEFYFSDIPNFENSSEKEKYLDFRRSRSVDSLDDKIPRSLDESQRGRHFPGGNGKYPLLKSNRQHKLREHVLADEPEIPSCDPVVTNDIGESFVRVTNESESSRKMSTKKKSRSPPPNSESKFRRRHRTDQKREKHEPELNSEDLNSSLTFSELVEIPKKNSGIVVVNTSRSLTNPGLPTFVQVSPSPPVSPGRSLKSPSAEFSGKILPSVNIAPRLLSDSNKSTHSRPSSPRPSPRSTRSQSPRLSVQLPSPHPPSPRSPSSRPPSPRPSSPRPSPPPRPPSPCPPSPRQAPPRNTKTRIPEKWPLELPGKNQNFQRKSGSTPLPDKPEKISSVKKPRSARKSSFNIPTSSDGIPKRNVSQNISQQFMGFFTSLSKSEQLPEVEKINLKIRNSSPTSSSPSSSPPMSPGHNTLRRSRSMGNLRENSSDKKNQEKIPTEPPKILHRGLPPRRFLTQPEQSKNGDHAIFRDEQQISHTSTFPEISIKRKSHRKSVSLLPQKNNIEEYTKIAKLCFQEKSQKWKPFCDWTKTVTEYKNYETEINFHFEVSKDFQEFLFSALGPKLHTPKLLNMLSFITERIPGEIIPEHHKRIIMEHQPMSLGVTFGGGGLTPMGPTGEGPSGGGTVQGWCIHTKTTPIPTQIALILCLLGEEMEEKKKKKDHVGFLSNLCCTHMATSVFYVARHVQIENPTLPVTTEFRFSVNSEMNMKLGLIVKFLAEIKKKPGFRIEIPENISEIISAVIPEDLWVSVMMSGPTLVMVGVGCVCDGKMVGDGLGEPYRVLGVEYQFLRGKGGYKTVFHYGLM